MIVRRLLFFLSLTLAFFILGEVLLERVYSRVPFAVWPPHYSVIFEPTPNITPGISGRTRFFINSKGIRGDEFSSEPQSHILAVGGSTTECFFLDQSEAWPALLQEKLKAHGYNVWVGNVGASGIDTRHHLLQVKYLLPQYPFIDTLLLMTGVNDLLLRLWEDGSYRPTPYFETRLLREAFYIVPLTKKTTDPSFKRTGWWQALRSVKWLILPRTMNVQKKAHEVLVDRRKKRESASGFRKELPDMTLALQEYRSNLNEIVDLAHQHSVRLILITQSFT